MGLRNWKERMGYFIVYDKAYDKRAFRLHIYRKDEEHDSTTLTQKTCSRQTKYSSHRSKKGQQICSSGM